MMKKIQVLPYDPNWKEKYEFEAGLINKVLGDKVMGLHHIGSTSVPGLSAKPDIDILLIIDELESSLMLQDIGYIFKGEINIPLRYFFSKNTDYSKVNLHICKKDHGFIDLQLKFRDYLRGHDDVCKAYSNLKYEIIKSPDAGKKIARLPNYTLAKNDFIKATLEKAGYGGLIVNFCVHEQEWQSAQILRQQEFDRVGLQDSYQWNFYQENHKHLVLYLGTKIIGYADIEVFPNNEPIITVISMKDEYSEQEYKAKFMRIINQIRAIV